MPPRTALGRTYGWLAFACSAMHGCNPDFDALSQGGPLTAGGEAGVAGTDATSGGAASGKGAGSSAGQGGSLASGGAPASAGTAGSAGQEVAGSAGQGTGAATVAGAAGATSAPGCPDIAGKAIHLAYNSLASVPRVVQDDFTIEAWIRKDGSKSATAWFVSEPFVWADMDGNVDDFSVTVYNGTFTLNLGQPDRQIKSATDVATNEWVHVAVTRNKTTGFVAVIVNGRIEASMTAHKNSLSAAPTLWIGSDDTNQFFFDGDMDELRIWSRARSPVELQDTMHRRLRGDEPGLVGYYQFDQKSNGKLLDSSSSHTDGTISGNLPLISSTAPLCDDVEGVEGMAGQPSL